jgi:hypothetical protein
LETCNSRISRGPILWTGARQRVRPDATKGDWRSNRRRSVIAESALSGFPPDITTWGRRLFDAKNQLDVAPHWALFPGAAVFLTVLSITSLATVCAMRSTRAA